MEYVLYSIDGIEYEVRKDQVDSFLASNPNAVLVSKEQTNEENVNIQFVWLFNFHVFDCTMKL